MTTKPILLPDQAFISIYEDEFFFSKERDLLVSMLRDISIFSSKISYLSEYLNDSNDYEFLIPKFTEWLSAKMDVILFAEFYLGDTDIESNQIQYPILSIAELSNVYDEIKSKQNNTLNSTWYKYLIETGAYKFKEITLTQSYLLPDDAAIKLKNANFTGKLALNVYQLKQTIKDKFIQAYTQNFSSILNTGIKAKVLIPGQDWQEGQIKLSIQIKMKHTISYSYVERMKSSTEGDTLPDNSSSSPETEYSLDNIRKMI